MNKELVERRQVTHHVCCRWAQWIFAVCHPDSLVIVIDGPVASEASRVRWRVVVWTVMIECLRLLGLSHPVVFLQRLLGGDHQMLLLHVMLELLVKAVQSINEFVLALMHHHSALRTQMRLMHKLLTAHELTVLVGVVVVELVTADRVVVARVDLDVLQTLAAQRHLMVGDRRTL